VFKRIFGDPRNSKILATFLMAALGLPEEEFDSLVIVDPHLKREFNDDKESILDVKVRLKSGVVIDVEIQVRIIRNLRQRIALANAKMLTEQIKRGEEYLSIKRVVSIVNCNGVLLPDEPGYYNRYKLLNIRSGREFTDMQEIDVLEPRKLPAEPDGGELFKWGQFFKAKSPEELAMAAKADPAIAEAAALVMKLNEDETERARADSRLWWQMDRAALRRHSYRKGRKVAESKYRPVIEAKDRELGEKDREIEELRRKLREAGIDT
jgi:predicted transposase/invertase (TIGR01784 family)